MNKILFVLITFFSIVHAGEWQVQKNGQNSVVFHSSTTLLDFKGTTNNIDGYIYSKSDSLFQKGSEFYFEVRPATFNTGIGKRDSDMRQDVLETDKFPVSSFKGKIFESKETNNKILIKGEGIFSLHGKTKELILKATLNKAKNKLRVQSDFSIFLKDYNIDAPTLLAFVKVAQEIKISLNFEMFKVK